MTFKLSLILTLYLQLVFNVFFVRSLSDHLQNYASSSSPNRPVPTVSSVNPGFCATSLGRDVRFPRTLNVAIQRILIGRTAEMGSRTLVHAALTDLDVKGSRRVDGRYFDTCCLREESDYVLSEQGREDEMRVWVSFASS